jgi:hypothetical protein
MTPPSRAAAEPERLRKEPAPTPDPLADVRADVQADAQKKPEQYLIETLVPEGGE